MMSTPFNLMLAAPLASFATYNTNCYARGSKVNRADAVNLVVATI